MPSQDDFNNFKFCNQLLLSNSTLKLACKNKQTNASNRTCQIAHDIDKMGYFGDDAGYRNYANFFAIVKVY